MLPGMVLCLNDTGRALRLGASASMLQGQLQVNGGAVARGALTSDSANAHRDPQTLQIEVRRLTCVGCTTAA
jgi:hypothetical protein